MRKKLLVFIIAIVVVLSCVSFEAYAEGNSDIEDIIASLDNLEEQDALCTKEGYNLIYLAKEYITANDCEEDVINRISHFSLEYTRQKSLLEVNSSVNVSYKSFLTENGDRRYYDDISWQELDGLYQKVVSDIQLASNEGNIISLQDEFFEGANLIKDISALEKELSSLLADELKRADNAILERVNLSLTARKWSTTNFSYTYLYGSTNEEYFEMLSRLVRVGYSSDNVDRILSLHESMVESMLALGLHVELADLQPLADAFIEELNGIGYITTDATPYILDNVKLSTLQRLEELVYSDEIQSLSLSKRRKIEDVYNSVRLEIEGADSAGEVQDALSRGEEDILEIASINDGWIWGAVLIGAILLLLLLGIVFLCYNKVKKEGRTKYRLLIEAERERIDKATNDGQASEEES